MIPLSIQDRGPLPKRVGSLESGQQGKVRGQVAIEGRSKVKYKEEAREGISGFG